MQISLQQYNQVIEGLRMQIYIHRQFSQEKIEVIKQQREVIDGLESEAAGRRYDLEWRKEIGALTVFKDGNQWCAVKPDFKELAVSPAWFGKTPTTVVEKYLKEAK
jgi:hypothetical protein